VNPYFRLFFDALEPYGIEFAGEFEFDRRWLFDNTEKVDAIQIHFPEILYRNYMPPLLRKLRRRIPGVSRILQWLSVPLWLYGAVYLRRYLATAKRLGMRVIWTYHDEEPHRGATLADRFAYRVLAKAADLIIFHSESGRNQYLANYPHVAEMVLMPHGNYEGAYPAPRPREQVIRSLGLRPDLPMVCCVGSFRAGKGLDLAVSAVAKMAGRVQLVIGGRPSAVFDTKSLEASVAKQDSVVLLPRRLSDQEYADIVCASEAVLLPYREITTSGALLSVLSLHRSVIVSDIPFFREMLGESSPGVSLVRLDRVEDLADAITSHLTVPAMTREAAAKSLADRFAWPSVIGAVGAAIQKWKCSTIDARD